MNSIEQLEHLKTISFEEGEKQLIKLHREIQEAYKYTSSLMLYETLFFDEKSKPTLQQKYEEEVQRVIDEVQTHTREK